MYFDEMGDEHRRQVGDRFAGFGDARLFTYELGTSGAVLSRRPIPFRPPVEEDAEYVLVHPATGMYAAEGGDPLANVDACEILPARERAFVAPGFTLKGVRYERRFRAVPVGNWKERAEIEQAEARHREDIADRRDRRERMNVEMTPRPAELLLDEARALSLSVCDGDSKETVIAAILFETFGYVELPDDGALRELYGDSYTVGDVLQDTDFGECQQAAEITLRRFPSSTPFVSAWKYLPDFVRYAALEYDRAFRSAHMID